MTADEVRGRVREVIAVALANGGPVEDEYDAADDVIDALGIEVVEWTRPSRYGYLRRPVDDPAPRRSPDWTPLVRLDGVADADPRRPTAADR